MEIPSFLVHFCRGPLEIPHVLNRGGGGCGLIMSPEQYKIVGLIYLIISVHRVFPAGNLAVLEI